MPPETPSQGAREAVRVEEVYQDAETWFRLYVFGSLVADGVDREEMHVTARWWRAKLDAYAATVAAAAVKAEQQRWAALLCRGCAGKEAAYIAVPVERRDGAWIHERADSRPHLWMPCAVSSIRLRAPADEGGAR